MGRSTVIAFLFIGHMAFGQDFLIRYNNANTDVIPDAGSTLDIKWDTGLDSSGTAITYNPVTEEWTLADTGRYLIMYSDQHGTTNTTNNTRTNQIYALDSAGSFLRIARSSSYNRKRNGAQETMNTGYGILYTSTTNVKIKLVASRVDNNTSSSYRPSRIADRSGMMILKLNDSWNYARYETTTDIAVPTTELASQTLTWGKTLEEDSPFTLQVNDQDIDIASNNLILATMAIPIDGGGTDQRTDLYGRLNIGGSQKRVAWTFIRNGSNSCDDGSLTAAYLWEHTSGEDISINCFVNEVGTSVTGTNQMVQGSNLQLVELPSSAKWIAVEATTDNFNNANTDFNWDTNPHIDAAQFTHSAGSSIIEVDSADSYLLFAGQFDDDDFGALRAVTSSRISVESTIQPHMGSSAYFRGSGTNCRGGMTMGAILPNLSAGDGVEINNDRLGTTTNSIDNDEGYWTMVKFGSIFPAPPPSGPDLIINGVEDPAKVNGVSNPAKVNGI